MKEIVVLSNLLEKLGTIDDYISFIWTERWEIPGDFLLELPLSYVHSPLMTIGNFIVIEESNRFMIIESLHPLKEEDGGSKLSVTGPSGETLLDWRVTLEEHIIDGDVQEFIHDILQTNLVAPVNINRTLDKVRFVPLEVKEPWVVTNLYKPSSLLTIITDLSRICGLSILVQLNRTSMGIEITLLQGVDRSYNQTAVPYVIFSEEFDNVFTSSFVVSTKEHKNVAVVVSDDLVYPVIPVPVSPEPSGFNRREVIIHPNVSRSVYGYADLTDPEFLEISIVKAYEYLYTVRLVGIFDGTVDADSTFKYGKDFYIGDIVQCVFDGRNTPARVVELVRSTTDSGTTFYVSLDFNL